VNQLLKIILLLFCFSLISCEQGSEGKVTDKKDIKYTLSEAEPLLDEVKSLTISLNKSNDLPEVISEILIRGDQGFFPRGEIELYADIKDGMLIPQTYQWRQVLGPSVRFLSSVNNSNVQILLPEVGAETLFKFELEVKYEGLNKILISKDIPLGLSQQNISIINGSIFSPNGLPLEDVLITVLEDGQPIGRPIKSDVNGLFTISLKDNSSYILSLVKEGFAEQVYPVITEGSSSSKSLQISLIEREPAIVIMPGQQIYNGKDGAKISIDRESIVDKNGVPIIGDVQMTITPIDTSNESNAKIFFGMFAGFLDGGIDELQIKNYGSVEFKLSHEGSPVDLSLGENAEVVIPLYINEFDDGDFIELGDDIGLWSLDTTTGFWDQESSGTIISSEESPTGLAVQANISNFYWWD